MSSVTRHADWDAFEAQATGRLVLLTTQGRDPAARCRVRSPTTSCCSAAKARACPRRPRPRRCARGRPDGAGLRSLNLAITAAIVLAEALRQTGELAANRADKARRKASAPCELDAQQTAARTWFEHLRDLICAEFEAIEREAGSDADFDYIAVGPRRSVGRARRRRRARRDEGPRVREGRGQRLDRRRHVRGRVRQDRSTARATTRASSRPASAWSRTWPTRTCPRCT